MVTLIGFATHGELEEAGWRILTTYLPLLASWFLMALASDILNLELALNPRQLWRPALSMVLAVPLAVLLRGLWLNRPILPIFAVVLAGFCMLGILIWRVIFLAIARFRR